VDVDDDGIRPSTTSLTEEIEELVREGYFDGVVGRLSARFPNLPWHDVEDAVETAVVTVLKATSEGKVIDEPRGYLYAVALNELRKRAKSGGAAEYDAEIHGRAESSAEDEILGRELFRVIKRLVDKWESGRMRTITLLFLESASEGERLSLVEAARLASEILGEQVPMSSVGKTKERGLRRLAEQLGNLDREHISSTVK